MLRRPAPTRASSLRVFSKKTIAVLRFLLGIGRLEDSKHSLEPGVSAWNLECDGPTLPRARYRVAHPCDRARDFSVNPRDESQSQVRLKVGKCLSQQPLLQEFAFSGFSLN